MDISYIDNLFKFTYPEFELPFEEKFNNNLLLYLTFKAIDENNFNLVKRLNRILSNNKINYFRKNNLGRYNSSNSIINLSKIYKHTILKYNRFINLDIKCSIQSITFTVFNVYYNIDLLYIKQYLDNQNSLFNELLNYYNLDDKNILKKLFIMLLFSSYDEWIKKFKIKNKEKHLFITLYESDCNKVKNFINSKYNNLIKNKNVYTYWYQIIENDILYNIYKYITINNYSYTHLNCCLESDGLYFKPIKKIENISEFLNNINKYILNNTGLNIQIVNKNFNKALVINYEKISKVKNSFI